MSIKVLYHSYGERHCNDGFGAAFCAWLVYGPNQAQYIPCIHGQEPPRINEGDIVFVLDFSFQRDVLERWDEIATVKVLDHHKSAQTVLEDLPFADFDMNRSGAQMAWRFFHPGAPEPPLISYIADRDLWKNELVDTRAIHLALSHLPQTFNLWHQLLELPDYHRFMLALGSPLLEQFDQEVAELVTTAHKAFFAGYRVMQINSDRHDLVSDALNWLCRNTPDIDFAVNLSPGPLGTKAELRSVGECDVSKVARQFGGGGHKNAAGCTIRPLGGAMPE